MIFFVKKEFFLRFFKLAAFVAVDKKIGASILGSHVLLSATKQKLSLVATDLDIELIVEEPLTSIEQPGAAVIPFRKISEICKAMTDDVELHVFIAPPSSKIHIESSQGFFSINYLDAQEFPVLSDKVFLVSFSVSAKVLQDLVSKTAFAMGDDDSRQFLNGVFLCFSNNEIVSVATDGHRLVVWEAIKNNKVSEKIIRDLATEVKFLLPRKSALDLLKILNEAPAETMVQMSVGENHVRLIINNITFTSKLLSANFPSYQKLIPVKLQNVLVTNKETLKACLLRAVALLGDRSQGIRLVFSKDTLQMTARNENDDLVQENISVQYFGVPLEICFNIKYLLEFLSSIDGDEVSIKMENAKSGVLMQDVALKSSYVLMPMQL